MNRETEKEEVCYKNTKTHRERSGETGTPARERQTERGVVRQVHQQEKDTQREEW